MPMFNVHIYREMRLFYPRVTADTPEEAAEKCRDRPTGESVIKPQDCEGDTLAATVDVADAPDFSGSKTILWFSLVPKPGS